MKNLKFLKEKNYFSMKKSLMIICLVATVFSVSCSKGDEEQTPAPIVYAEENPLNKYHELAGFTTTSNFINSGNYEFGLAFSPNVKGKINSLFVTLPETNANVRVTIWDYDAKTVLRTETVNVSTANTAVTKSISEMILDKDKKYLITMNTNDWYKRSKADNSNATYPITAGNIKVWEYRWVSGASQIFPTNISLNYNAGDLSFNFQQVD